MPIISDAKLEKQFTKHKGISEGSLQDQHSEARDNHAFYSGDQMAYTATVMDKSRRSTVVFNKVKPYVDAVAGFMIQLRRKPQYQARKFDNEEQREFSEYLNGISDYARENANLDHLESRQDREMLITGYAALDTNIVYEENPDGEIKGENVEFMDIFWDPQAREPNLLDSRWVFRRKKFSVDEALKRFKGSKPEDFDSVTQDQTGFNYNPQGGLYDKIAIGVGGEEEDLVEVYYYQWWDLQTYYRAKNPLFEIDDPSLVNTLAQLMESMRVNRQNEANEDSVDDFFEFDPFDEFLNMTPQIKSDMDAIFRQFDVDVDYQVHQKKVYYTAVLSSKKIFLKFKSPDQQGFTIKFKTGDYDYANNRWFGMVDSLKEPARYSNKSMTEMLYVIAANSKGGVMYEESAVEDPARFEQQWATTKSAIKVSDGAVSQGKIAPKAVASLPNGYENIYAISNQSLGEVTGINKEFLGNAQATQVSALLESQRINQTISTLASYFDSVSLYQKEHARMMITFIRMLAENSSGRLIRIIGVDGAVKFDELSEDKLAEEYDVDITEAPTTATQKQETTQIMMGLADKLALLGQNIYPVAIQYLPIKQADKQRLLEILSPPVDPEAAALAQEQAAKEAEIIEQGQRARIAKDIAEAELKNAQIATKVAEANETVADTENTIADTAKKEADILKVLSETEQTNIENNVLRTQTVNNLDIII